MPSSCEVRPHPLAVRPGPMGSRGCEPASTSASANAVTAFTSANLDAALIILCVSTIILCNFDPMHLCSQVDSLQPSTPRPLLPIGVHCKAGETMGARRRRGARHDGVGRDEHNRSAIAGSRHLADLANRLGEPAVPGRAMAG